MLTSHATQIGHASLLIIDFIVLVGALYLLSKSITSNESRDRMIFLALGSFSILGRWVMEPLPNIQPVTMMVLLGGIILGARRGIALALIITLVSNVLLGHGLWTIFQAAGWSMVAISGALLADKFTEVSGKIRLGPVLFAGIIAGFVFDWVVSLSVLPTFSDGGEFFDYLLMGLPYDMMHAFGNFTIGLWLIPVVNHLLFSSRLETSIEDTSLIENSNESPTFN